MSSSPPSPTTTTVKTTGCGYLESILTEEGRPLTRPEVLAAASEYCPDLVEQKTILGLGAFLWSNPRKAYRQQRLPADAPHISFDGPYAFLSTWDISYIRRYATDTHVQSQSSFPAIRRSHPVVLSTRVLPWLRRHRMGIHDRSQGSSSPPSPPSPPPPPPNHHHHHHYRPISRNTFSLVKLLRQGLKYDAIPLSLYYERGMLDGAIRRLRNGWKYVVLEVVMETPRERDRLPDNIGDHINIDNTRDDDIGDDDIGDDDIDNINNSNNNNNNNSNNNNNNNIDVPSFISPFEPNNNNNSTNNSNTSSSSSSSEYALLSIRPGPVIVIEAPIHPSDPPSPSPSHHSSSSSSSSSPPSPSSPQHRVYNSLSHLVSSFHRYRHHQRYRSIHPFSHVLVVSADGQRRRSMADIRESLVAAAVEGSDIPQLPNMMEEDDNNRHNNNESNNNKEGGESGRNNMPGIEEIYKKRKIDVIKSGDVGRVLEMWRLHGVSRLADRSLTELRDGGEEEVEGMTERERRRFQDLQRVLRRVLAPREDQGSTSRKRRRVRTGQEKDDGRRRTKTRRKP